jgi:hypothetical protein
MVMHWVGVGGKGEQWMLTDVGGLLGVFSRAYGLQDGVYKPSDKKRKGFLVLFSAHGESCCRVAA